MKVLIRTFNPFRAIGFDKGLGYQPVSNLSDYVCEIVGLSLNIDSRKIGDSFLEAISFSFENQDMFILTAISAMAPVSVVDTNFKRHI